jgi:ubiquitin-protein ligase
VNPRLRRLESDYRELRTRFDGDPRITITPLGPYPPERYQIVYRVPSLRLDAANNVQRTEQTVVTMTLPAGYPREKPHAETLDPIFHPNFGAYVCIADFWAPGQSLGDIVASIGDMLQFRKYNIRSPLNAVAAEWANEHATTLPLSEITLGSVDSPLSISISTSESDQGGTP